MTQQAIGAYQPRFIIDQDPLRFGGQQADYLAKAEEAINATRDRIISARENGENLRDLFFELIADLSKRRMQIARDHGTRNWEEFGKRRDQHYPSHVSNIILAGVYEKYNQKILSFLSRYLKEMESKESPGQFKKEWKVEEKCDGRISTLQIEVLNQKELAQKGYASDPHSFLPPYISREKLQDPKFNEWSMEEIEEYRKKFLQFKNEEPENYKKRKMSSTLYRLSEQCPSPGFLRIPPGLIREKYSREDADRILGNMKSLFVIATLRTEVDKKLFAMTHYITWMYENQEWLEKKDPAHHPIQRMFQHSKVMVLHQDEYSIEKTLQEISKIFETTVSWTKDKKSLQQLKDSMALFYHLATHNIRDMRGGAAENEWLEHAIYRSLKVKLSTDSTRIADLEAFVNPLFSTFKKVYDEITHLELDN